MAESARNLPPEPVTVEAFLAWQDGTDTRYELWDGRIVATATPSPDHSVIAGNVAVMVGSLLMPPCRIAVEWGIP